MPCGASWPPFPSLGCALGAHEIVEDAAHLQLADIGRDVDQPVERAARKVLLLRLEHALVLEERVARALVEEARDLLVRELEVPREPEAVVAARLGLGRHEVGRPDRNALAAVALGRPRAVPGAADIDI